MGQGHGGLYSYERLENFIGWRVVTDRITFVMERKLVLGIKAQSEAASKSSQEKGEF